MPCGGQLHLRRLRSDGPLSGKEVRFCRDNGIALAYDTVQIGWVTAICLDDIDPHATPHQNRRSAQRNVQARQLDSGTADYKLRLWHAEDLPQYMELLDDPAVWAHMTEAYPDPLTAEIAQALIEASNAGNRHEVRAVERDGELVGQVRLLFDGDETFGCSEISYWLGREYWNRGIGTDIVSFYTRHSLAQHPQLTWLFARVHSQNMASQRVLEKSGYQFAGPDPKTPDWVVYRISRDNT